MGSTSATLSTDLHTPRSHTMRRAAAIGAVVAAVANVAIWAVGRAADVSFLVTPVGSATATEIGVGMVVATTLVAFAAGMGLFALAARRSGRWARAVVGTGVVVAVVSAAGPLSTAADTSTGVLLAAMHLLTGAVFAVTAAWAGR